MGDAPASARPTTTPPPLSGAGGSPTVSLLVRADPSSARDFSATLRELLLRIGVELAPGGVEAASDASLLARIRIDFSDVSPASVTVQDAWSGEVRLQRALTTGGSRSIDIETAAHIVYTAVEALARERQRESAPAPLPPLTVPATSATGSTPPASASVTAAVVSSPQTPSPRVLAELSPFYALHPNSGAHAELNSGAGLLLGAGLPRLRLQPSVWLSAEYRLPFTAGVLESPPTGTMAAALRAQTTSFRLTPTIKVLSAAFASLLIGPVVGLDLLSLETDTPFEAGSPRFDSPRWEALVGAVAMARVRIAANAHLFLAASLEYGLARRPFRFTTSGMGLPMLPGGTPVGDSLPPLAPWRVSTALGLAISFPIL